MLVVVAGCAQPHAPGLEILPKHFQLHPGEQIHYQVLERAANGSQRSVDYEFSIGNPEIVRPIEPKWVLEAVKPGRTELVVRTASAEGRVTIEVGGPSQPPMGAVHHSSLREIVAGELLFVGHANLDGFDHTAVAKSGIDRLVRHAKDKGVPVVYWVSQEYPNWYTDDRHPDYAIISEGQEHRIRVDARRVMFAGGSFMFCVLRNVQMTLHGMLTHDTVRPVHFVFPADAIWMEDLWGAGDRRPYPAPMVLLSTVFARHASDAQAYDEVVVPFLDRVITQFPVLGYPPDPPTPTLRTLLEAWQVVVRLGGRFERVYRQGDPSRTVLIEFQGV